MIKHVGFLFASVLLLAGCSAQKTFTIDDIDYVVFAEDAGYFNKVNTLSFYNQDGVLMGEEKFNTQGDLSYSYIDHENHALFQMGPGGLYEYSFKELKLRKHSDKNINLTKLFNDDLYYYHNLKVTSELCSQTCRSFDDPIGDFWVNQDFLYVELFDVDTSQEMIHVYQEDELVYEYSFKDSYSNFYEVDDTVYIIIGNQLFSFRGEELEITPLQLDTSMGVSIKKIQGDVYIYTDANGNLYELAKDLHYVGTQKYLQTSIMSNQPYWVDYQEDHLLIHDGEQEIKIMIHDAMVYDVYKIK